ncbi:MAG: AraC family transcriptional regulator [Marinoscillum sp.]
MAITIFATITVCLVVGVMIFWMFRPKVHYPLTQDEENHLKNKEEHFKVVDQWLNTDKRFLENDMKLDKVARSVHLTERQVSTAINTIACQNFSTYLNSLRIKEAKLMLSSVEYDHFTIEAIGQMAGFSNKVSFYKSFKRVTGLSPTDYKKNIRPLN